MLLLVGIGGIIGATLLPPDDETTTTTTTTDTDGGLEGTSEDQWVLVARLNSWDPSWPNSGYDITVECYDAATSSKVHSGRVMDEIDIAYNNHEWMTGTPHDELITGFMVTIQVYALGGGLMLTTNDYVDIAVGCPEATYDLYDADDPTQRAGSLTLKWVRV